MIYHRVFLYLKHLFRQRFLSIKSISDLAGTLVLFLLFSASFDAAANHTLTIDVGYNEGVYSSSLSTIIHAPTSRVYPLLTSYNNLNRYSRLIYKSQLLTNGNLLLSLKTCFFFICFDKQLTMTLEISNNSITGQIIPEHSDFKSGSLKWQLSDNNTVSFLQFSGNLAPKFWLPPIIGPLLIKHKLRSEAKYSVNQLERLSDVNNTKP